VAFSPNGETLAAAGSDDNAWLWSIGPSAQPAALAQPLTGPAGPVRSLAFSPDGRFLAAGSDDGAWLWNLDVNAAIQRICATTSNTLAPAQWRRYVSQLPYAPPCRG
jgi:WD40 repeat protein